MASTRITQLQKATGIKKPGVKIDVAEMINAANPGKKRTRPRTATIRGAAKKSRRNGEPTAEQIAIYADWVSGMTYPEIGKKYGYVGKSFKRVIDEVNRWLIPQYMEDIRGIKCEHTQRLLHMVCEAMAAWERSKGRKVKTKFVREEVTNEDGTKSSRMVLVEQVIEASYGDVAYLNTARAAMDDIREIWGANAPVKVDVAGELDLRVAGLPVQEARNQLADELMMAVNRLRNATPGVN